MSTATSGVLKYLYPLFAAMEAVFRQSESTVSTHCCSLHMSGKGWPPEHPLSGQKPTPVATENCQQLHSPWEFGEAGGRWTSLCAAGQSPAATALSLHDREHLPNMLPMQLPVMSGSFIPSKIVAISAGEGLPLESRKLGCPAGRSHLSFTTAAPHCSGMKMKSALRCSACPFFAFVWGAKFQFQNVALLNELLPLIPSMSRCVSSVVSPSCVMPGMTPKRPHPQLGPSGTAASSTTPPKER